MKPHMSGRIVAEVLQHAPENLGPASRLVLVCLAERARDGDRLARKSVARMAREAGMSERTVKRALTELSRRGLIVRKAGRTGPYHVQAYWIPPLLDGSVG